MADEENKGMGCFAKGCLVVAVLLVAFSIVLYFKAGDWGRAAAAWTMNMTAEATLKNMKLPDDEREAAMEVIREFTQKVQENKISAAQGQRIAEQIMEGPVAVVIAARMFEVAYVEPSDLDEQKKKAAHVTVSRFAHGIATEKIPRKKGDAIKDIVMEPNPADPDQQKLRESIKPEELEKCLTLMKAAADEAEIGRKGYKIDIAAEIRKAIQAGIQEPESGPDTASD